MHVQPSRDGEFAGGVGLVSSLRRNMFIILARYRPRSAERTQNKRQNTLVHLVGLQLDSGLRCHEHKRFQTDPLLQAPGVRLLR